MDYRFNAEEWKGLSPQQQANRCRLMAGEARILAEESVSGEKLSYLKIADEWTRLAEEIERRK